jgi:WS/DGAT/MGAT family acyltransferase
VVTTQASGDRLTALDAAFWHLERTGQLLHVGGIYTVEGPLDHARLLADIGDRLHLIPRYTQRVVPVPFTLAHPTWEAAPTFDLRDHVQRHVLRPPGDDEQLATVAARLFARPLHRGRPLWELHQIDGYRGERSALVAKVHHCMIDGVSGVQLMGVMFDVSPRPQPAPPAPPAEPVPPLPSPSMRVVRALEDGVRGTVTLARRAAGLAAEPSQLVRAGGAMLGALREVTRVLGETMTPSPYNGHVSTLRRVAWATLPIHELKSVKNRIGGTLNDAILTIISAALRRDLQRRGIEPDGLELRAMCPVNVRSTDEHLQLGNRVSMLVASLPVGIHDPFERLRQVRAGMARVKASGLAQQMSDVLDLIEWVPAPLQVPLAQLPVWMPPFNTVCTNVPGPPVSLYVQGRRLETLVPLVPLAQGIGLAFAILSYTDTLTIGVTADPALVGDPAPLAECLLEAHEELCRAAGIERQPPRPVPVTPERQRRPTRVA